MFWITWVTRSTIISNYCGAGSFLVTVFTLPGVCGSMRLGCWVLRAVFCDEVGVELFDLVNALGELQSQEDEETKAQVVSY